SISLPITVTSRLRVLETHEKVFWLKREANEPGCTIARNSVRKLSHDSRSQSVGRTTGYPQLDRFCWQEILRHSRTKVIWSYRMAELHWKKLWCRSWQSHGKRNEKNYWYLAEDQTGMARCVA